jgi:NADPH:quinone reductase
MRAIQMSETGGPQVLRPVEAARPVPGEGQVLIRVAAAGVNYTDVMARQGVYLTRESAPALPAIPGSEVAGTVAAVGPGVAAPAVGSRVAALVQGGYAEYAVAPAELAFPLPVEVDFAEAVGYLVQGITAMQLLRDCARMRAGERVLVHSAAGGVGTLAVQLAKELGASSVVATAGSRQKLELAASLGADVCVDYTQADWSQEVLAATDGRGVDIVLDAVGGDVTEQSLACLGSFGRLLVYGVSNKRLASFAGTQLMARNQTVGGYWLRSRMAEEKGTTDVVPELLELAAQGKIKTVVQHVFPLDQAGKAHQAISDRQTVGKVVLLV